MCYVRARNLGMKSKIIDGRLMQIMSEFRVRFGHCGRSVPSPSM